MVLSAGSAVNGVRTILIGRDSHNVLGYKVLCPHATDGDCINYLYCVARVANCPLPAALPRPYPACRVWYWPVYGDGNREERLMRPETVRKLKIALAVGTVGTCIQAISPQGCIGLLQQNVEAALRTGAVVGPELYQSWIFQILKNLS
jgi:hypothetical protein